MTAALPHAEFAGLRVSPLRLDQLLGAVRHSLESRRPLSVTYLNPDYALRAFRDSRLRSDIDTFDLVLVDGNGVRLLAPLFGVLVPQRLDTDTVAPAFFRLLHSTGSSVFLFGCAPGVAATAAQRLTDSLPGLRIAGTEHGFHDLHRGHPGRFHPDDSAAIVAAVNASGADALLVSLPTPTQQRWVAAHRHELDVPVVMTGGSYLDHLASSGGLDEQWYPRWADALRLNWFYRLVKEPRRLLRRYTLDIVVFAAIVLWRRAAGRATRRRTATVGRR